MPRRRRAVVREVLPDPVYNSTLVEKFVNSMMWEGKKNTAQGIFYEAMTKLQERTSDDPLKAFKKAVENAKPLLEGCGTVQKGDLRVVGETDPAGGRFGRNPDGSPDGLIEQCAGTLRLARDTEINRLRRKLAAMPGRLSS